MLERRKALYTLNSTERRYGHNRRLLSLPTLFTLSSRGSTQLSSVSASALLLDVSTVNPRASAHSLKVVNLSCEGGGWWRRREQEGKVSRIRFATQLFAKIMHSATVSCISSGYSCVCMCACVHVCMCACVHGVQVRYIQHHRKYTGARHIGMEYWNQTCWYGVLEPDLLVWNIGTRLTGMEYWNLTCLGMRSSISVLSLSLSCTLTSTPSNSSAPSREGGGGCRSAKHSEQSHGIPHLLVVFSLSAFEQYPQENK